MLQEFEWGGRALGSEEISVIRNLLWEADAIAEGGEPRRRLANLSVGFKAEFAIAAIFGDFSMQEGTGRFSRVADDLRARCLSQRLR